MALALALLTLGLARPALDVSNASSAYREAERAVRHLSRTAPQLGRLGAHARLPASAGVEHMLNSSVVMLEMCAAPIPLRPANATRARPAASATRRYADICSTEEPALARAMTSLLQGNNQQAATLWANLRQLSTAESAQPDEASAALPAVGAGTRPLAAGRPLAPLRPCPPPAWLITMFAMMVGAAGKGPLEMIIYMLKRLVMMIKYNLMRWSDALMRILRGGVIVPRIDDEPLPWDIPTMVAYPPVRPDIGHRWRQTYP